MYTIIVFSFVLNVRTIAWGRSSTGDSETGHTETGDTKTSERERKRETGNEVRF